DSQRDVPKVAGRGALLCGTLGSVLELTWTVASPAGPAWAPASSSFLLGLAGFLASVQIDRRAREADVRARAEWDKVAAALGERFAPAAGGIRTPDPAA